METYFEDVLRVAEHMEAGERDTPFDRGDSRPGNGQWSECLGYLATLEVAEREVVNFATTV